MAITAVTDISGLVLDIDPHVASYQDTAGTTPSGVGDTVARVDDQSGNADHATQGTAANRPVLQADANGWRYLDCDGTNDVLGVSQGFNQPFTLVLVAVHTNPAEADYLLAHGNFDRRLFYASSTYTMNAGANLSGGSATAAIRVFQTIWNGASSVLRIDGTEHTGNPGTGNWTALTFPAYTTLGTQASDLNVYRVLVWSKALSSTERTDLANYLAALYASPPGGGAPIVATPTPASLTLTAPAVTIIKTTSVSAAALTLIAPAAIAIPVKETFTEASNTAIALHVPDSGGSYTQLAGTTIVNATLDQASNSTTAVVRLNVDLKDVDHVAEIDITNHNINAGLYIRVAAAADSGFLITADKTNQLLNIQTRTTGGTPVTIASAAVVLPATFRLKASAEGQVIRGYVDGVLVVTAISSLFSANTRVGFWGNTNNRFDNLYARPIAHAIEVSEPLSYRFFGSRWQTDDLADIPFSITLNQAAATSVEARFNGGDWVQVAGATAAGPLVASLDDQAVGQGDLEFRLDADDTTIRTIPLISIGDIVAAAGQSNSVGFGTTNQTPTASAITPIVFRREAAVFTKLVDPSHDTAGAGGSYWPWFAREWMENGRPFCLLAGAEGNTDLVDGDWQPNGDPYEEFVAMCAACGEPVRLISWLQGETDALQGETYAAYKAALKSLITNLRAENDELANAVMLVSPIGQVATATAANINAIRRADIDAVAEQSSTLKLGFTFAEMNHTVDQIHIGRSSDTTELERAGKRLYVAAAAAELDGTDPAPRVSRIDLAPTRDSLTVIYDGEIADPGEAYGTDAWQVYDAGTPVTITAVTWATSTSLTISLDDATTGTTTVDSHYGNDVAGEVVPLSPAFTLPSGDTVQCPAVMFFGQPANLAAAPDPASITFTAPAVTVYKTVRADAAVLTLSAPAVTVAKTVTPEPAVITFTAPRIVKTVTPDPATVTLTAPAVTIRKSATPAVATITFTAPAPNLEKTVSVTAATITLTSPVAIGKVVRFNGPYCVAAVGCHVPGAVAGDCHVPGPVVSGAHIPGPVAGSCCL